MRARPIWLSALLIAVTIATGLMLRRIPLGMPFVVVKFGGSVLWAMMIYWIVSTVWRRLSFRATVLAATAAATMVELFKLNRQPSLDAFRLTVPGTLLLGRVFSVADLIFYAVAIAVAASIDCLIRQRHIAST